MAPLKGLTLGQRQKYYNQLVELAIASKSGELPKINFEEDDVDNMIKIDIACRESNVDYIVDIFKCDDMLYVSRAINKSTWLITDPQYAHIINPKYLHSQLFPHMNAKAVIKLMLHIRRHLKDEIRVKAFYKYVNERDTKAALQWLGNCSLEFIQTIGAARADEIPVKLLKRLCRKSFNILRVVVHSKRVCHHIKEIHDATKYYLKSYETAEKFLDIMESFHNGKCAFINYNENYTNKLMEICPERIKQNFQRYYSYIDLKTFVKQIKIDEIRSFLMANSSFSKWKTFATLTPFLVKLPREDMLNFLRTLYGVDCINSVDSKPSNDKTKSDVESLFQAIESKGDKDFSHFYRWYRFAPFDLAFRDIKKLISVESSTEERHSMLIVLLTCAGDDFDHVKTVLEYYHDKHINEPNLHKKTFVNSLLAQHDTFRFDDCTWKTLNALFHSLGVYDIQSGIVVEACLNSIIVHNVLRDLPVHEVVEEKFEIISLKDIKEKLSLQEQDKLFNYLYKLSVTKLCKQSTSSETGMHEAIKLLKTIWTLLEDWNKTETHHRFVIDKIVEFGEINNASSWIKEIEKVRRKRRKKRADRNRRRHFRPKPEPYVNIPSIYNMVNSYRRELFEKSLILHASEGVLLNALKHDPGLLARYTTGTNNLRCNDEVSLNRFLSKLRIYWSDSLAIEWTETNIKCLQKCTRHRALVRGILTLLPHNKILDFIKMYAPDENKIHWSEINEIELSIQKHIAKNMHIVRPQLPAEVALWYAKGDYLQYALLSVNTMYYNLRSSDIRNYIKLMLSAPVSLQKHGIRLAFAKYKTFEIINISKRIWKTTSNSSIRMIIYKFMFKLLCKERKAMTIKAIWIILSSFTDDLNEVENKIILYTLVQKVFKVPLSVVGDCLQKAYFYLKTLQNPKLDHMMFCILNNAQQFIEYLDSDFVEKTLLSSVYDIIENCDSSCEEQFKILSAYLLCSHNLEIQMQKYNNVLHPVIEQCVPKWADGKNDLLVGFQHLLQNICLELPHHVFKKKMTMPIEILANIQNVFVECSLCTKEHYKFIRLWQLTVRYLEILIDMIKASDDPYEWEKIRTASTKYIASICFDFIAADDDQFFPSIYLMFKEVLGIFFENFGISRIDLLLVLDNMLEWKYPSMYLLVLELIPKIGWGDDFVCKKEVIKRKIYFHPSEEVTMHYFCKFSDKYNNNDDVDDEGTGESQDITDSEEESIVENVAHYERELTQDATLKNDPTLFGNLCNII